MKWLVVYDDGTTFTVSANFIDDAAYHEDVDYKRIYSIMRLPE